MQEQKPWRNTPEHRLKLFIATNGAPLGLEVKAPLQKQAACCVATESVLQEGRAFGARVKVRHDAERRMT